VTYVQQPAFGFAHLLNQDFTVSATTSTKGVHHLFQGALDGSGIAPKPLLMELIPDVGDDL